MAEKKHTTIFLIAKIALAFVILAVLVWRAAFYIPPKEEPANQTAPSSKSIDEIIAGARSFGPILTDWYGKAAPDFAITDLAGKEHKLSDYRGKDVLVIFWATWCMPCRVEVPDLIELRNDIGTDKLAMLAISSEDPATVKRFADMFKLNYTVAVKNTLRMPEPFSLSQSLPSAFFIRPDGTFKMATIGVLQLKDVKAILEAD